MNCQNTKENARWLNLTSNAKKGVVSQNQKCADDALKIFLVEKHSHIKKLFKN